MTNPVLVYPDYYTQPFHAYPQVRGAASRERRAEAGWAEQGVFVEKNIRLVV